MFANLPFAAIVQNALCSSNGPYWICVSIKEIGRIWSLDKEVSPPNETLRLNGAFRIDLMTQHSAAPRPKRYTHGIHTLRFAGGELKLDLNSLSLSPS